MESKLQQHYLVLQHQRRCNCIGMYVHHLDSATDQACLDVIDHPNVKVKIHEKMVKFTF